MAGDSPAAVLVDGVNGVELAVEDGSAIPTDTRAVLVSGKDGSGDARVLLTNVDGSLVTSAASPPSSASISSVAQNTSAVTLLAANASRKGALVFNDGDKLLYVKLGASASPTDWSVKLLPGGAFVLPYPAYTGLITGIWSGAGSGSGRITEMT